MHKLLAKIRFLLHLVKVHPILFFAMSLAVICDLVLPLSWVPYSASRFIIVWNVGVCTYLGLVFRMCMSSDINKIHQRALAQAKSKAMMIALVILATVASLVAVVFQLVVVKDLHGTAKIIQVLLAIFTILSSWAFIHTVFALRYAHDYYESVARGQMEGLQFPNTSDPEYGDFLYCAFIIGTSGQTADVSFTSKPMRRMGSLHSVLSFLFNTTVLAMAINIVAGFL